MCVKHSYLLYAAISFEKRQSLELRLGQMTRSSPKRCHNDNLTVAEPSKGDRDPQNQPKIPHSPIRRDRYQQNQPLSSLLQNFCFVSKYLTCPPFQTWKVALSKQCWWWGLDLKQLYCKCLWCLWWSRWWSKTPELSRFSEPAESKHTTDYFCKFWNN